MKTANQPLVSIGIPAYQRESYIGRALQSALSQDYKNIEILVSDNASTDKTAEIIQELAKKNPRIRFHRQSENIGLTKNFNFVLNEAKGEFFLWLGDDDW